MKEYTTSSVWLRIGILEDLKTIDEFLKPYGYRLYIFSGYRHPRLQRYIVQYAEEQKGNEFAKKMLSNPDNYVPHATGGAFDLELWDVTNQSLLPTKFHGHLERHFLENTESISIEDRLVLENRRLIHNILTLDVVLDKQRVFVPHPFEYWHYGRNEKLSAFFSMLCKIEHDVFYEELSEMPSNLNLTED